MTNATIDRVRPLDRLMQAAANYNAAQFDASYRGAYSTSSTTTFYVPEDVYWRLVKWGAELNAARQAAMERAFL